MIKQVERDERTIAVEKASYSLAYTFMGFALLVDVAYRSFVLKQSSFDLLAIVVLSGLIATAYQARQSILNKSSVRIILFAVSISIFVGVMLATLR